VNIRGGRSTPYHESADPTVRLSLSAMPFQGLIKGRSPIRRMQQDMMHHRINLELRVSPPKNRRMNSKVDVGGHPYMRRGAR